MIDFESKTDAEWKEKIRKVSEDYDKKLMELQKELDSQNYLRRHAENEQERLTLLLKHVLGYFLTERKIEVSEREQDLHYMKDVIERYHEEEDA